MARKEKKYHFIYKTTNTLSGKYYIGMHSTDNLDDGYMGSGNRLRLAIRKHGKENFVREIIEYCESRKELASRESEIVNLNEIAKIECMNMRVGGDGGHSKAGNDAFIDKLKTTPEFKEEFSKKAINRNLRLHKEGILKPWNENYDWTGKKHSEETKKKMSKSKLGQGIGKNNSQYGTMWITNDIENRKITKSSIIPTGWRKGRVIN